MKLIPFFLSLFIFFISYTASSQQWQSLGSGIDGPGVYTMVSYNGELIVGGNFYSAGGVYGTQFIAKWNGSSWSPVGPPNFFTGAVYSLTVYNNELIAAGDFNPGNLYKIAKWNGTSWSPLGFGNTEGIVRTVCVSNDQLFAGGTFTRIGGSFANNIAEWHGFGWNVLGSGTNGTVIALIIAGGSSGGIIAGGSFSTAGGVSVSNVATWVNGLWYPVGNAVLDAPVYALERGYYGELYAGGSFYPGVRRLSQGSWIPWGDLDTAQSVYTMRSLGGVILAGGTFELPGTGPANIAYIGYNNPRWRNIGGYMNDWVQCVYSTASPYGIYAAGRFTTAGGVNINKIARLDSLSPLSTHYNRYNLNRTIADNVRAADTIRLPGEMPMGFVIKDVNLTIDTVFHTNDSDLEFILTHNSIRDTVIYRVGGSGDNFIGTVLNDSAGAPIFSGTPPFTGQFRPTLPLSRFNGTDPEGDWILEIYDRATGNTGMFEAWSLTFQLQPIIAIQPISTNIPSGFALYNNYPNPFNPATKIKFDLPQSSYVKLVVYDALGREVKVLINEQLRAGTYETDWNASNNPSGVYFYRFTSSEYVETKKMILLK
jgi:subtilisin-like proprotein convertase family protein